MDSRFRIGNFRFGLDPILNFIPFGGQIATFIISLVLVSVMYRNGASSKVAVKMLLNVTWDALLGSIPIFGNVFDFFNKANEKNVKLLQCQKHPDNLRDRYFYRHYPVYLCHVCTHNLVVWLDILIQSLQNNLFL